MGIPHEGMLNVVHGRLGSAMKAGHVDFYRKLKKSSKLCRKENVG